MSKIHLRLIAFGFLSILTAGLSQALDDPAKTESKPPAKSTEKAAGATATGAKTAGKATGKAATTAAKETAQATEKAAGATATGAKTAGKATGKAATTAAKETAKATEKAADATVEGAKETGKAMEKVFRPGDEDLLDINSASEEQLKMLPGIGSDYAAKIIAGRPYANKAELKSKGIVPDSVYNRIAGFIVARQK